MKKKWVSLFKTNAIKDYSKPTQSIMYMDSGKKQGN